MLSITRSSESVRLGWSEQFKEMAVKGDDALLIPDILLTEWEVTEWEWEHEEKHADCYEGVGLEDL